MYIFLRSICLLFPGITSITWKPIFLRSTSGLRSACSSWLALLPPQSSPLDKLSFVSSFYQINTIWRNGKLLSSGTHLLIQIIKLKWFRQQQFYFYLCRWRVIITYSYVVIIIKLCAFVSQLTSYTVEHYETSKLIAVFIPHLLSI